MYTDYESEVRSAKSDMADLIWPLDPRTFVKNKTFEKKGGPNVKCCEWFSMYFHVLVTSVVLKFNYYVTVHFLPQKKSIEI